MLKDHYDKLYTQNPNLFSNNPDELCKELVRLLPHESSIYEFGSGAGRNALFLAKQGFQVIASDISTSGLEAILTKSSGLDLKGSITVEEFDITSEEIKADSFAFLCSYTLHHIQRTKALDFIKQMQQHTIPGGFNLITTFSTNSEFFLKDIETKRFYTTEDELKRIYSEWEIIKIFSFKSKSSTRKEDGKSYINEAISILAKKRP